MGYHLSKKHNKNVNIDEEMSDFNEKNSQDVSNNSIGNEISAINRTKINNQQTEKKNIDKEHVTIERIFRITLEEENTKFLYLEMFLAQIMSQGKELKFRMKDLDDIMIQIINSSERKEIILQYLLETYHRAVEMIEKRFKAEYDNSYKQIRRVIGNYITLIINYPHNFGLNIQLKDIELNLKKYLVETDEEELGYFLMDLYHATCNDISFLSSIFSHFFKIIHKNNIENKPHFFNIDKMRKNMMILSSLFEKCPLAAQAYVQEAEFMEGTNGRNFQNNSYLGLYLNVAVYEADINALRVNFPAGKSNYEFESILKVYTNKLNDYLGDVVYFLYTIYSANQITRSILFKWLYTLFGHNLERTKMYQNNQTTSTIGFLLNCLIVLLKIFIQQQTYLNINYNEFIFSVVYDIDPLFTLSKNKLNFDKFDRINLDLIKEIIENTDEEYDLKEYSLNTEIFYSINFLMNITIKSFDDEVNMINNKYEELLKENKTNDPLFKDFSSLLKASVCYLKNPEMLRNILKFSEIDAIFLISLNNKKYPQISLNNKVKYAEYFEDFYNYMDTNENFALSLLPSFIPKNILQNSIFIRKHNSDILINELNSTKIIVYFSIIYSSQIDLIKNPHLRSEILDILIYLLVVNSFEKSFKIASINKLLSENFVKNSLIYSLMRVFIDAERLGTSNQFYEKFSIRHKILYLIENILQANKILFTQKIIDFANSCKEDCTKMINLLINDLTFLNDECIERLMDIKRYQDLIDDAEKFNSLDDENKQLEEKKFKENDRRIRTETKLFNSSMDFMVKISEICQEHFLKYKLGERLANLLNYSLDVFTSKRGLKLKVKNMAEYGFNPQFILKSLISTYASFVNYVEFLEFIVKDERSYKIDNFEKVINIYSRGKIKIDFNIFEQFKNMVLLLKEKEIEIKSKIINYDDAPEEFLDPITTFLMEDPVLLPTSGVIVDRNTIETHLLSDQTDPFNRSKLSTDMLVPQVDLKNKITEYKNAKII